MSGNIDIRMAHGGREFNITQFVQSITLSGSYTQFARNLSIPVLCSNWGAGQAPPDCPLGADIFFSYNGVERFIGKIQTRDLDTSQAIRDLGCVDLGMYLGNKASRRFKSITPELMTRKLCGEFGIELGEIAATGVPFSRNFVGVSLYKMIMTAYTLAPRTSESRYVARFSGRALDIIEKAQGPSTCVIRPGSNLIRATVKESIANLITQVEITDSDGTVIDTVANLDLKQLYGVMQQSIVQSKHKNARAEAKKLLDDNGESQTITVELKGCPNIVSGDCVILQEPNSGLYGLFWVDSDKHYWAKDGTCSCTLALNFRNLMDESEVGSAPDA